MGHCIFCWIPLESLIYYDVFKMDQVCRQRSEINLFHSEFHIRVSMHPSDPTSQYYNSDFSLFVSPFDVSVLIREFDSVQDLILMYFSEVNKYKYNHFYTS